MYTLAKAAEAFLNDARNSYNGAIPEDVMLEYERMKAKEDGKESPDRKRIKETINHYLSMAAQATENSKAWLCQGDIDMAKRQAVHAQAMASNAEDLLIDLNDVE